MASYLERQKQLAEIDRKSSSLLTLSLIIMGVLAAGVTAVHYPSLGRDIPALEGYRRTLPQLVIGLAVLVVLSGIYILSKQRELNALRRFIIMSFGGGAMLRETYPRDSLTGVLSRSALPDILAQESRRAERLGGPVSLVLWEIRDLLLINEREGNLVGDLILKEFALALQRTSRQTDVILRYAGRQFLCLLPATPLAGAEVFVQRVRKSCDAGERLRNLVLDFGLASCAPGQDPEPVATEAESDLARRKITPVPPSDPGTKDFPPA